jgi:hypothetical protein
MDRRGRNRWTTQIAPKWSPLGTGCPCLILPHLHIVILKGQGNYLKKERYNKEESLKRKNNFQARIMKNPERHVT